MLAGLHHARPRCRSRRSGRPAASRRRRSRRRRGSRPPGRSGSSGGSRAARRPRTGRCRARGRPGRGARAAGCAMPRPWWASWTRKATSASTTRPVVGVASSAGIRSKRPTAIILSATVSTNATRSRWSTLVNREHVALGQLGHRREEPEVLRLRGHLARRSRPAGPASSAPIGRRWATCPSRSRTSASQCRGYAAVGVVSSRGKSTGRSPRSWEVPRRAPACPAGTAYENGAAWPARPSTLPCPTTSRSTSSTSTSATRCAPASWSTPTRSSTAGRCPTRGTASSRCSGGSSTRWPTWTCGPTAGT